MSLYNRTLSTYKSGGLHAVYNESLRYWRDHPARILFYAKIRTTKLRYLSPYAAIADPTKLLRISPDRIEKASNSFSTSRDIGRIVAGTWDEKATDFSKKMRYQAIEQRYVNGDSWEETGIYDYYQDRIETRGRYDGCYTLDDIRERYYKIDQIYNSMKKYGYDNSKVENFLDHVCVNISRNGEFLHAGIGNHRLSIAKLLNLDEIPVRVVVRHESWQQKRERIYADEEHPSESDLHPDLQDVV